MLPPLLILVALLSVLICAQGSLFSQTTAIYRARLARQQRAAQQLYSAVINFDAARILLGEFCVPLGAERSICGYLGGALPDNAQTTWNELRQAAAPPLIDFEQIFERVPVAACADWRASTERLLLPAIQSARSCVKVTPQQITTSLHFEGNLTIQHALELTQQRDATLLWLGASGAINLTTLTVRGNWTLCAFGDIRIQAAHAESPAQLTLLSLAGVVEVAHADQTVAISSVSDSPARISAKPGELPHKLFIRSAVPRGIRSN